jgi:hypothetical protein
VDVKDDVKMACCAHVWICHAISRRLSDVRVLDLNLSIFSTQMMSLQRS